MEGFKLFLLSSNITAFSYCFYFRYDLALRLSFILSLFLLRLTTTPPMHSQSQANVMEEGRVKPSAANTTLVDIRYTKHRSVTTGNQGVLDPCSQPHLVR